MKLPDDSMFWAALSLEFLKFGDLYLAGFCYRIGGLEKYLGPFEQL